MGCRHSASPPSSPKLLMKNEHLKKKIFSQHKPKSTNKSISLEQILDGSGKYLYEKLQFNATCLIYDLSPTHLLLYNQRQLYLVHLLTLNIQKSDLPNDSIDIQEIVWSTQLNCFLLLTTNQLYQTGFEQIDLKLIEKIQFIYEGHRKSYMTVNGDDLIINRSFGDDLRHYSLKNFHLLPSIRVYKENNDTCITTVQLNSNKILALAIATGEKQMIDFIHLPTDQFLARIQLDLNENISYPIDLHTNGLWFAKTCRPYVNIGHCLITSDGQIKRVKLFSSQDNFIRSLRLSSDRKWLILGRQHALEIYSL